jgi:exopolyphosphatase/guanosine-5'-triphosphate,3'-diphosphate pyrophosphatase
MELPDYDPEILHLSRIPLAAVRATTARLLAMTKRERAEIGSMHPGRVDVIGGGAIVVRTIADELAARAAVTELIACEHDILDGIALALAVP